MSNPIFSTLRQTPLSSTMRQCPFCDKEGLKILPLRHSAFCSDDGEALATAPDIGLGEEFPLEKARLTARMMREGYLYILIDQMGLLFWKAYFVTADARLFAFAVDSPPSRSTGFSCYRDSTNPDTSLVSIEQPEQVHSTWWLFTPDPLSERKLDEYKANREPMARDGKLQAFSPAAWINGDRSQAFSLEAGALNDWVAEYVALKEGNAAFGSELLRQPFRPLAKDALTPDYAGLPNTPLNDTALSTCIQRPRLEALRDAVAEQDGVGLVMRDALGVVQELNAWRNAAMEGLEPWMNRERDGVSNRWRFQVASRLIEVREELKAHRIQQAEDRLDAPMENEEADTVFEALYPDQNEARRDAYIEREARRLPWRGETAQYLQELEIRERAWELYPDTGEEARAAARERAKAMQRQVIGEDALERRRQRAALAAERVFEPLDMDEAQGVLDEFDVEASACEKKMEERVQDHLIVLQSPYVLNALHAYDDVDLPRGWAFALQVALCTLGMEACESGDRLISEWAQDIAIAEENLFWRAYGLNQEALLGDMRAALAEAKAQAEATSPDLRGAAAILAAIGNEAKRAGQVIDAFDAANQVLDEAERGSSALDWFSQSQMGVLTVWYSQAAKKIFNSAMPSQADHVMASVLVRAMNWRMGKLAIELRMHEMAQQETVIDLNRSRSQIQWRIRRSIQAELEAGKIGNFYALRIGVIVALIEAANLFFKAQEFPEGKRQKAEFAAAALGTLAVSLELMYAGAEWTMTRYSSRSLTHRVAAAWGGGLRLYGGLLGATGGIIGVALDAVDGYDALKRGRVALAGAYTMRSLSTLALSALGLGVALSASGPYLKVLVQRTGSTAVKQALVLLHKLTQVMAQRAVLVFMRTWLMRMGWVALAVSAIIWLLEPDAIEKWSEKSVFKKDRSAQQKRYENEIEEIAELEAAFTQVVAH